jgi:hypothetical protein
MDSDYKFYLMIIFGLSIFAIFMIFHGIDYTNKVSNLPVIERTVFGTITKGESTECVFIVNGTRMTSNEHPCLYKEGEKVNVRIRDNGYLEIMGKP